MAIKKVNRINRENNEGNAVNRGGLFNNTPVVNNQEELNTINEEVIKEENVTVDETPVVEEDIVEEELVKDEIVEAPIQTQQVKLTQATVKEETPAEVTPKKKVIGKGISHINKDAMKIYPKSQIVTDIQKLLADRFEINPTDTRAIFDAVETALVNACQVASVRFAGGILKAVKKEANVFKSPAVDYYSYKGNTTTITLTGVELNQPEKYRGQRVNNEFHVTEVYDYDKKAYVPAEGVIEIKSRK